GPESEGVMTRRGLHGDPPQIRELMDAGCAAKTANSAVFHPAKWHLCLIVHGRAVDVTNTRLNPTRHFQSASNVTSEYRRGQAIFSVVCASNGFFDTIDPHDRLDRSE